MPIAVLFGSHGIFRVSILLQPPIKHTTFMTGFASYNITNDRLKVWFDERLSDEDYKAMSKAGFTFWHASKCFTRVWSAQAEDAIKAHSIEIVEDDTPDDVEARVDRYSGYAEKAESAAQSSNVYLESDRCNTVRRRTSAANDILNNLDAASHWNRRIEASIRHAKRKEDPGVIARRIDGLETDLRKYEKDLNSLNLQVLFWSKSDVKIEDAVNFCMFHDGGEMRVDGKLYNYSYKEIIAGNMLPLATVVEHALTISKTRLSIVERWIEHINNRLLYERAVLASTESTVAKLASNEIVIELRGAIKVRGACHNEWMHVTKVNPKSVEAYDRYCHWNKFRSFDRSQISEVASAADVENKTVDVVLAPEDKFGPKKIVKATTSDGKRPEVLGVFGFSPGEFCFNPKCVRYYLITKVSSKSVEYLNFEESSNGNGGKTFKYFTGKMEIRILHVLKSPEQAKIEHPDLLAHWESFKKQIAAQKAQTEVQVQKPQLTGVA